MCTLARALRSEASRWLPAHSVCIGEAGTELGSCALAACCSSDVPASLGAAGSVPRPLGASGSVARPGTPSKSSASAPETAYCAPAPPGPPDWLALPRASSPLPRCGLREREREVRPSAFAFSPVPRCGRTGPFRSLAPLAAFHLVLVAAHPTRLPGLRRRALPANSCSLPASPFEKESRGTDRAY